MMRWTAALVLAATIFGCKGDRGEPGPKGDTGPQGDLGPKGDTGPQGPPADVTFAGRVLEAEGAPLSPTANTGATAADPTASGGSVRLASAAGAGGRMWAVGSSDLGGKLGNGRVQVSARAKIASATASSVLARLMCQATRAGDTTPTTVSPVYEIHPNELGDTNWHELSIQCDFLPDDVNQLVLVENFVTGITDLSLDYVRITPLPSRTRLLAHRSCPTNCQTFTETFAASSLIKVTGASDPLQVTATVSGGPVLVTLTATWTSSTPTFNQCYVNVFDAGGTVVTSAHLSGLATGSAATFFNCAGTAVFPALAPGRYVFKASAYVQPSSAITYAEDRQLTVWEL